MNSEDRDPLEQRPFRICENCGQMTPTQSPQCAYCGYASPQAVAAAKRQSEERRFLKTLFSRSAPVSYLLIAVNVVYYFITASYGLEAATLIAFGAKTNSLLRDGEWFRLVTPIFIHGGLLHLGFNSYALYLNGPLVEKLYGSARFLLIYLLAGIGGSVGSYIWQASANHPDVPSVGASGAIFGLFGLLAAFGFRYKEGVPENLTKALRSSVLPIIAINLIIGFSLPFIDNGAHLGGLVVGALLTLVIPYLPPDSRRVTPVNAAIMTACLLVIGLSFIGALGQARSHIHWREDQINRHLKSVNDARAALVSVEKSLASPGSAEDKSTASSKLSEAVAGLEQTSAPDPQAEPLAAGLTMALRKQLDLLNGGGNQDEMGSNLDACISAFKKYDDWLATEGKRLAARHGLTFRQVDKQENSSQ